MIAVMSVAMHAVKCVVIVTALDVLIAETVAEEAVVAVAVEEDVVEVEVDGVAAVEG